MSKRKLVTIEDIADFHSLWRGWINASSGEKASRHDVQKYGQNVEAKLRDLQKRLLNGTWRPDKGHSFMLFTEGKWRLIHTVGIEDRIVHYSLVEHFALNKRFVRRTFGSIKKRGTLKASKQVRKDLRESGYDYVIKLDAHKYYPNINKAKLIDLVRSRYKGSKAINLFAMVVNSYQPESELGVSIGALTSQDNGNFYLTPFDCFVLELLGVRFYTRYVDDMVMLVPDKKTAKEIIPKLIEYAALFGITFGKIDLFPIASRRIDFCGYAVNKENNKLRKSTLMRYRHKLIQFDRKPPENGEYERSCICSYLGLLKYCDSNKIQEQFKSEHYEVFKRIDRFAKGERRKENEMSASTAGNGRVSPVLQSPRRTSRRGRNRRGDRCTICRNRADSDS
jgi:hypothetical protein